MNNDRFAHIDSLRAIAALLVIWMHVSEVFVTLRSPTVGTLPLLQTIPSTLDFGRVGVLVFFLVSGFLIPSSLKGSPKEGARTFLIRRFFRLYPLYWVSIPFGVITMWWMFGKTISSADVALNFTMIQERFRAESVSGLYWTLKLELYFYALCLALFCLNLLKVEKVIVLLAVGALPVYVIVKLMTGHKVNFWGIWSKDIAFISFMFAGALWRRAHDGQIATLGKMALAVITAWYGVVFPLLALFLYVRHGTLHLDHSRLFLSYPIATLIFVAGSMVLRIRWQPMAWTGKISYSMYLLHPIIFYTLYWSLMQLPPDHVMRNFNLGVYLIGVMLLTVCVSSATYAFIEKPMIDLGARLTKRDRPQEQNAVVNRPSADAEAVVA